MRAVFAAQLCLSALSLALVGSAQATTDPFSQPLDPARWTTSTPSRGASVDSPVANDGATDGQSLLLGYPGPTNPKRAGPGWSTLVQSTERYLYGSFSARLQAAPAQGRAGIISAFFTYFNDGSDSDADGVADNSEIDFELLSAEPSMVYITVFTDYDVTDGVERFTRTTTKVDVATGRVWRTEPGAEHVWGDLVEVAPLGWSIAGFDASAGYHTYGFDWQPDHVTFWMDNNQGERQTLWRLDGQPGVSIPAVPANLMFNLWHNDTHWGSGKPAPPPRADALMWVDSVTTP